MKKGKRHNVNKAPRVNGLWATSMAAGQQAAGWTLGDWVGREARCRSFGDLLLSAFHEASHAVVHFALERPHEPAATIKCGRGDDGELFAGRYTVRGLPDLCFPNVTHAWVKLAGRVGEQMAHRRYLGTSLPRDLRPALVVDRDHDGAANALFPDDLPHKYGLHPWTATDVALRRERRAIRRLLARNWLVVQRVARALLAEGTLDEDQLFDLIEMDDLQRWPDDYCRSQKRHEAAFDARQLARRRQLESDALRAAAAGACPSAISTPSTSSTPSTPGLEGVEGAEHAEQTPTSGKTTVSSSPRLTLL